MDKHWIYLTKLGLFETTAIIAGQPEMTFAQEIYCIQVTWNIDDNDLRTNCSSQYTPYVFLHNMQY